MVSIEVDGYSVTAASLPLPSRGGLRVRRRVCDHPRRWDRSRPRGGPPSRPPPKKNPMLAVNSNLDTFGATPCLDKPRRHTGHAFAESDGEVEKVYPRGRPKRHGGGSVAWKL